MGFGTLLYDSVFLASDELMQKQPGRKALIILSDGADHGSRKSLEAAMEAAQRADTVVYSILFSDDRQRRGMQDRDRGRGQGRRRGGWPGSGGGGWPGSGGRRGGNGGGPGGNGGSGPLGGSGKSRAEALRNGRKVLQRASKETGGQFYEVSSEQPIEQVYAIIADELRTQYGLGYTPDKRTVAFAGYHKINLAVKQKDLVVQTRDGYYADR